jgi:hypothetical protein
MTGRKPLISTERLAAIRSRVPMPALVAEGVAVQHAGRGEYLAACPFHAEQTPSFHIYSDRAHCYGCGWHGDQIGWLMAHAGLGFLGAVHYLCNRAGIADPVRVDLDLGRQCLESDWRPFCPIPANAPVLINGGGTTARVFNPKRSGERRAWSSLRPALVHPYCSAAGQPLGYVLRVIGKGGKKFTPTVTFCENAAGARRWCIVPFARPRPLYRLERLAARSTAAVVLVEGEKTCEAAQRLLPSTVATTWPGGSKAYLHVDFSPLRNRKIICVPDADQPGREAFCGRRGQHDKRVPGIVDLLADLGAMPRLVEPETALPAGWDLADAEAEGWDTVRALAWFRIRLGARHAA